MLNLAVPFDKPNSRTNDYDETWAFHKDQINQAASNQAQIREEVPHDSGPIIAEIGISTEKIFIWTKEDHLEVPNSKKTQKEPLCSNDSQTKFALIRDIFSQLNTDEMIIKISVLIKPTAEEQCDLSSMVSLEKYLGTEAWKGLRKLRLLTHGIVLQFFSFFYLLSGAELEILCFWNKLSKTGTKLEKSLRLLEFIHYQWKNNTDSMRQIPWEGGNNGIAPELKKDLGTNYTIADLFYKYLTKSTLQKWANQCSNNPQKNHS